MPLPCRLLLVSNGIVVHLLEYCLHLLDGVLAIEVLRALLGALRHDASRHVRQTDARLDLVDVLTAVPAAVEVVDVDVIAVERDVIDMKRGGYNAVRAAHYPHDPAFLDACDRYGKKSPMYTVEIGYVLPAPYDLEVVGLPAESNGTSGDQKQTLELTWKLNTTMKNAVSEFVLGKDTEPLGTSVFPLPEYNDDGWVISVLMEPGNPEFKPLRNVLSPAFTEADDTEHGLKLLDKWEGEINDGFEKSGDYWHKEENGVLTVRYRLSVEPPPSGEGEYNYRWGSLFYFKVKAVYENGNQVREYESPESSLFGGYVVDPSGPKAEDDGRTLYDPSISGSGTDLSVYLTVTTPNGSSSAGAQINIYRRTPEDIQYVLVNKEPLKVSGQDVSVTDTNVFGYDYIDYRFEYVDQDGNRSCLSGKKTVIIQ